MEPRLVDSLGLGDLQKVSLGVLENQSFVPTTAQSLFILNVFHEGTRAAKFFHHRSKLSFRNDKRVPRIRSRAVAFGQGGFSLGKQSDMVLPQFHEYAIHVWAVEPLQGSCPKNLRVKLLGPVRIHHCQDKVIQVPNIAFGLYFSSHYGPPFSFILSYAKVIKQSPYHKSSLLYPRPRLGGEGRVRGLSYSAATSGNTTIFSLGK